MFRYSRFILACTTSVLALAVSLSTAAEQNRPSKSAPAKKPVNLDFESQVEEEGLPEGWHSPSFEPSKVGQGYESKLDRNVARSGKHSGRIRSLSADGSFGALTQAISPEKYLGKRIRLTGWLHTDSVTEHSGLWLRIDGTPENGMLGFDNMNNRGVLGTTDWTKYEVVLDVPKETQAIVFGSLLTGQGTVWIDDLTIETVDKGVPTTGRKQHVEIEVATKILDGYVGTYELQPGVVFVVTRKDKQLIVQITGQSPIPIFAESKTEFFYKVVDAQITFVPDADGKTTKLILHQHGMDMPAKKTE